MRSTLAVLLAVLAGPATAGPVDFGPWFILKPILAGLFYGLYLVVPLAGIWLWRRNRTGWVWGLAGLWLLGAIIIPVADWQRARSQTEAHWDLRVLPDAFPIAGKVFLADDTVRTPHDALNMYHDPGALYGLYGRSEALAAMTEGPVDFASLRVFRDIHQQGVYKNRRRVDIPAGTRIYPDYLMLSGFYGPGRTVLDLLSHPDGRRFPPGFGARFAIVEVADPAAFDLRKARVVLLLPHVSQSYYSPPFNPLVRDLYYLIPYREQTEMLMRYFCKGIEGRERDRCRRDI